MRPLRWILVGSLALNLLGVWWGLPGKWAPIELLPEYVMDGLSRHFSHGWFDAYPPLQYYVLTIAMAPFIALSRCCRVSLEDSYLRMVLVDRLLSVAAAAGIVAATYSAGARAFGRRQGLWAAGIMALTVPFVYYAKTANVDVPYLFWFALSFVFYLRVLQGGPVRDYVLFAAFATFSVCTKDQAYGLYLLMPIPILVEIRKGRRPMTPFWIAGATAGVLFALIYILPFNWAGFVEHVRFITGGGSVTFRVFDPTPAGRWGLFLLTLDLTEQALGWPFTIAIVCGVTIACVRRDLRRTAVWLLVPIASYYLTFIDVILYNYDRFMLPVCLILAVFGGLAFEELLRTRYGRGWRVSLATAAVAYSVLYAASVDYLMIGDSRYKADRWLHANTGGGAVVGTNGQREYIPTLDGLNHVDIPDLETLARVRPGYMVVNADYARAYPRDSDPGKLTQALQRQTAGYTLVARFRQPLPWGWLPGLHRDLTGARHDRIVFTTVRNINPTIEIFALNASGAADRRR